MCKVNKPNNPIYTNLLLDNKPKLKTTKPEKQNTPVISRESNIKVGKYPDKNLKNEQSFSIPESTNKTNKSDVKKIEAKTYNIDNNLLQGLLKGTIKPPFSVNIKNTSLVITKDMLTHIAATELQPKSGVKITDVIDIKDGKLTKGYGCTDLKLHPYIKDEKSAFAVLAYQVAEHMKESFNFIPSIFLKNLNQNQVKALAGACINIKPETFKGEGSGIFKPVKVLIQNEQKFINKTENEIKEFISNAMAFFVGKKNSVQEIHESGLSARRTSEFLISNGLKPKDPYDKKSLADDLKDLVELGESSAKKVIQTLISIPGEVGKQWRRFF